MICKYKTICKLFDSCSKTCLRNGDYYGKNRKAGCYRRLEEIEHLTKDLRLLRISEIKNGINHQSSIKLISDRIKELEA